MKTSNIEIIKESEGLRLTAYMPTPNDVPTIGYGHTSGVRMGTTITEAQAEKFLRQDIKIAEDAVNRLVKVPLTQNQFDALVSFTFNLGQGNFGSSTLLRKLNAGDYVGAAEQFSRWNKQTNKKTGKLEVLRGLTIRRAKEAQLFLSAGSYDQEPATPSTPDKPIWKSKEVVVGGVTAGIGALGSVNALGQNILIVAMVVAGAFFVYNRLKARKNGERLNG